MRSLIEAILDVTRIRGGHLVLDKKPHDLRMIVDEVVVVHLPLAESRDVRLDVAYEIVPRPVVCDRARISQVLANLVANAIQHSPRGKTVRIETQEGETTSASPFRTSAPSFLPSTSPMFSSATGAGAEDQARGPASASSFRKASSRRTVERSS